MMCEKKKVIVYGLGKEYHRQSFFIEDKFQIVGISDKKAVDDPSYIKPEDIKNKKVDYIYVTSDKWFNQIKMELARMGVNEEQIISKKDVIGDFGHIRRDWVIEKLQKLPAGGVLLDAGAGEMQYAPYCKHLRYIAQDFGEYDPAKDFGSVSRTEKWDTSRVNIKCDIIDMPIENETIDNILCSEVFEHLKDPILAIKEFSRIIKSGGTLLLTAPCCSLTHMSPYYFANGFSKYWYYENLAEYGFKIREIVPDGNFFKWLGQEVFRVDEMARKYCKMELASDEISSLVKSIELLNKLSLVDKGSAEVLCFGYLVESYKE